MKKVLLLTIAALLFSSLVSCQKASPQDEIINETSIQTEKNEDKNMTTNVDTANNTDIPQEPERMVLNYDDMKAMWLSQFDLQGIYSNNGAQRNKEDFTQRIKKVLANVKLNGFNTVILQVRPYADSFYPSEVYPPSSYVTGSYTNDFLYDPIEIIIKEAHEIDLSIQGWINPLRAMTTEEIKLIDDKYKIKKWYNEENGTFLVEYNGRFYLNPAYSETRSLIIDGVTELISNYDFDGVHMDDYFYPTTSESFDSSAYLEYRTNGGKDNLKQFRYNNLNLLVSGIYSAVKEQDKRLLYGISPEGNMSNATDKAFADVYTWCSENGYIDYICPQVYFGLEHATHPFDKISDKWAGIIKNPNVKLVIGMTFGKALSKTDQWAGSGKDEWANNTDVMQRCINYTENIEKCTGVAVFCYQYYYDPITAVEVSGTKTERSNFTAVLKDISWNDKNS